MTDAEIYEAARRRRWPYVDEPRPTINKRRPPNTGALVVPAPPPEPLAPAGAAVDPWNLEN